MVPDMSGFIAVLALLYIGVPTLTVFVPFFILTTSVFASLVYERPTAGWLLGVKMGALSIPAGIGLLVLSASLFPGAFDIVDNAYGLWNIIYLFIGNGLIFCFLTVRKTAADAKRDKP